MNLADRLFHANNRGQRWSRFWPALLLSALLCVLGIWGIFGSVAQSWSAISSAPAVASVLELLERRSPGGRTTGKLNKAKAPLVAMKSAPSPSPQAPTQRALGKIFNPPAQVILPGALLAAEPDLGVIGDTPLVLPLLEPSVDFPPLSAVSDRIAGLVVPTGGISGGGGGGGGVGGGAPPLPGPDFSTDAPIENVTAAVPEPSTWGMMIIGFGLCGFMMRRRKRHGTGGQERWRELG